jgi:hypothetical protein
MAYEVQESCLCGWINTWSVNDEPSLFETEEEAEIALDDFFEDCRYALLEGYMPDIPDREDFRIVEIKG